MPDMAVTPGENYEVIFDYYSDEFTGTINFGVNTANRLYSDSPCPRK